MTDAIRLRLHHLIDIFKHFGNGRDLLQPHHCGHAQHEIARRILSDPAIEIELVCENDDICRPCRHLSSANICDDILGHCNPPLSKRWYNDDLDRKLFAILGIEPGHRLSAHGFLKLVLNRIAETAVPATHPGQSKDYTENGLLNTGKQWGIIE